MWPHPREELRRRGTLVGALRLVSHASRGQLAVAVLDQVGVLGTEECLPLEGIVAVEVPWVSMACDGTRTLLVGGGRQRGRAVVIEVLYLGSVLESCSGAWSIYHGGSTSKVLCKSTLVVVGA